MTRVAARWAMEPMKPQARSTTHRRTAQQHQQRRLAWLSGGSTPLSRAGSPRGVSGAYALPCGVLSSHRLEAACRWVWAGPSHRRYPLRIHESSSLTERAALARRVPRCGRSCARPVVFSDARVVITAIHTRTFPGSQPGSIGGPRQAARRLRRLSAAKFGLALRCSV